MSLDRPTGSDGDPDRFFRREDRPFPVAPADREAAPELSRNTLSMEDRRAAYDRVGTLAELQAEARAYEKAQARAAGSSDTPGPASTDSASDGEGSTEVGEDGALPLGTRPGVQDTRADAELQAVAPEYTAVHQEASAAGVGRGQVLDGQYGFFGRPGDPQDQGATEPGDRVGDEHATTGTWTSADTPSQPEQAGETDREKDSEAHVEDGQGRKPKDLVQVQHLVPDDETDRPAETPSEAAPDRQLDDPRMAAMERQMERMMATVEAMRQKLEASEARNDALEAKTVQLKQELDELKSSRAERRPETGQLAEGAEQPEYREPSESAEASEPRETLVLRDEADPAATGLVDERAAVGDSRDELLLQEETERRGYTEETKKVLTSGWGLLKAAGVSVPGADLVLGGQETREAFEELPADQQYQVMRMGETAGLAFSSMPPETAVVALGISLAGPAIREKFADIADRWRRKD